MMAISVDAKYFDGQSSIVQQVNVVFRDTLGELALRSELGNISVWRLEDLYFDQYDSSIEVRNRHYSGAILKIDDSAFIEGFYIAMKQHKRVDIHSRLLSLGFLKIVAIAMGLLGLIVVAYFYVLPPIAEKSAALLPESVDTEIGEMFMGAFLHDNLIDTSKSKYLSEFAAELNLKNDRPLKFLVVNSSEVNAFAVPSGQIVVFSGILNDMKSSDELAALLGHEASHVNQRHSIKMLCRNLAGYMVVSLLFSDVNGVMAVLAENAQQLHSLSYSRAFEQEADELGLKILMDNKINPNGMVQLFAQLEKESKMSIPQIISTHPLTEERKGNMRRIIAATHYEVSANEKLEWIFEQLKN